MTLLSGSWSMTEHYEGDIMENCYSQTHIGVNMDTGETLYTDIIKFGLPTFYFSEYDSTSIFNTFILKSENIRDLYGTWSCSIIDNKNEINIQSYINEYMSEDTTINGHNYSFYTFVPNKFEIYNITDSKLVLTTSNDSLIFERIF
jgi:hypothetical protein